MDYPNAESARAHGGPWPNAGSKGDDVPASAEWLDGYAKGRADERDEAQAEVERLRVALDAVRDDGMQAALDAEPDNQGKERGHE